jgi:hypothetical protein
VCIAFSQRGVFLHLSKKEKERVHRPHTPATGTINASSCQLANLPSIQVYGSDDTWAVSAPICVYSAAGRNFAVQLNADRQFLGSSAWIMMDLLFFILLGEAVRLPCAEWRCFTAHIQLTLFQPTVSISFFFELNRISKFIYLFVSSYLT